MTVVDQAYFEYVDDPDYPDAVERYVKRGRRALVLRTFSKIYGLAGLRVGYAVGPLEVCAALAKLRRPFDLTTQRAGGGAREPRRPRRARTAQACAQRRGPGRARAAALREHGLEPAPAAAGNFVFVDLGEDARPLYRALLREGVIVRPLRGFGAPTAIRISGGHARGDRVFAARSRVRSR